MSRLKNVLHWILCKRGLKLSDLEILLGSNKTYVRQWLVSPDWREHKYTRAFESAVNWDFDRIMTKYEDLLQFGDREPRGYLEAVKGYWVAMRENPLSLAGTTYRYLIDNKMTLDEFAKKVGVQSSRLSALMTAKIGMTPLMYDRLCRVSNEFKKHPPIGIRCHNPEHVSLLQLALDRRWIARLWLSKRYHEFKRKSGERAMEELVLTYRNTASVLIREMRLQYTGSEENLPDDFENLSMKLSDSLRSSTKTLLDAANQKT